MMNRFFRFLPLLLAALLLAAARPASVQTTFTLHLSSDGEVTLTAFLPEHPDGRAILAFPGGGYRQTSIGNNAQWAPLYNSLGISYFILKYRMPEGHPETTLGDAEAAMRLIRENASRWHVNPTRIGVMGTSAGGHLATMMATCAPQDGSWITSYKDTHYFASLAQIPTPHPSGTSLFPSTHSFPLTLL